MPGNNEDTFGQKLIDGGSNKKNDGNDSLIAEKAVSVGPAKPATKAFDVSHNTPEGQVVK